jgi:hypothetical protein
MVRCKGLVQLAVQESDGTRLVMEPSDLGLHGALPFCAQKLLKECRRGRLLMLDGEGYRLVKFCRQFCTASVGHSLYQH